MGIGGRAVIDDLFCHPIVQQLFPIIFAHGAGDVAHHLRYRRVEGGFGRLERSTGVAVIRIYLSHAAGDGIIAVAIVVLNPKMLGMIPPICVKYGFQF